MKVALAATLALMLGGPAHARVIELGAPPAPAPTSGVAVLQADSSDLAELAVLAMPARPVPDRLPGPARQGRAIQVREVVREIAAPASNEKRAEVREGVTPAAPEWRRLIAALDCCA